MSARVLAAGAFVALLGGCSVADSDLASIGAVECISSDDCFGNLACVNNTCVSPSAPDALAVEITPAASSPFVRTQYLVVQIDDGPLQFTLPRPTDVDLQVLDARQNPVSASLSFFSSSRIPGRELELRAFAGRDAPSPVRLLEGEYSVRIQPIDVPGIEVASFNVRSQPERVTKLFQLPEQYRRLYGQVTSSRSNQVRLEGVQVQATGVRSGLASTVAVTDAEGRYEVRLPDTPEAFFTLQAEPRPADQPAWSFRQVVRVELDGDRERDIELDLVDADDRGTAALQVVGLDRAGTPQPVANARVTLTATVAGVEAQPFFQIVGTTDGEGRVRRDSDRAFTLPLLRARYLVQVQPPRDSAFRQQQVTLDFTTLGPSFRFDAQVSLLPRTAVEGAIRSASGQPVGEALVSFVPDDDDDSTVDVVTNPDGSFDTRLDPGRYLMIVEPLNPVVDGEPLPVTTREVGIEDFDRQTLPILTLPSGAEVVGLVIDPVGAPEVGAEVEFFVVTPKAAIPLGKGRTDETGRFLVVLPQP